LSVGFNLLIILIASAPVLAIADGLVAQQLLALLTIIGLIVIASTARADDVAQTAQITRRLRFTAVIPAIWMVFQAIPLPVSSLSHSIWTSAAAALQASFFGHISIDPGDTISALSSYLAGIALIVVTIFVTRDRQRAELTLQGLCAITIFTVMALVTVEFGHLAAFDSTATNLRETLTAFSALGIVLNLAAAVRVIERYESRRGEAEQSLRKSMPIALVWTAGALICLLALASVTTANVGIVTVFGIVTFALVQAVRRCGLPPWSIGTLCATAISAGVMIVVWRYDAGRSVSLVLQFATATSLDAINTAQRMVSDATLLGNGAGTFAALLPIYQEVGAETLKTPTMAAAIAIEWGRPALVLAIASAIGLLVILFLGALSRGRDSFFPAAAAACVMILLGEAFCDASLAQSAVALVGEVIIGLGLAQSISRIGTG
jgi:hypothetical protein